MLPSIVGLYTLASLRPRRIGLLAAAVTGAVLVITVVLALGATWSSPEPWAVLAWSGMPAAVGDAVRSQRAIVAAARERAERAEATREEEAQRRVAEERLHIARELHDVVAHHIAVMTVQAGVAGHLLDTDPAQAREALDHVRGAGQTVLTEMSTILGVLREDPERGPPAAPGLGRRGRAGRRRPSRGARGHAAGIGLADRPALRRRPRRVPAGAGGADQRAQARGGAALVEIAHTDDRVRIDVTNPAGPRRPRRRVTAWSGMRERVTTAGGTLEVGPLADGTFRVHAELPVAPERAERVS